MSALATILSLASSAGNADFTAGTRKYVQFQLDHDELDETLRVELNGKREAE